MSGFASLLLRFAWASGLVVAFLTIRSFEETVRPAGPRRPVPIVLAAAVIASLGLPWTTTANGQITSSGWLALGSATAVGVILLAIGVGALAALPDWGGPRRDLHSLLLSVSLLGIVAGNWLTGASGWPEDLQWGATASLVLTAALAAVEAGHLLRARRPDRTDDVVDLTADLRRLDDLRAF